MSDPSGITSTFDHYDAEFTSIMQQIEVSLNKEPPSPYTQGLLQQCDDLIKQMSIEARSLAGSTYTDNGTSLKERLLMKVRNYKAQYQSLQAQSERQGLLQQNGRSGGDSSKANAYYEHLQKNEDSLAQQNETLERARRTMQETEQVALEITDELGRNRETLMSAHDRVRQVSGLTGRARRILSNMSQRAMQQKMILHGVAVSLVVAFLILLWMMWR